MVEGEVPPMDDDGVLVLKNNGQMKGIQGHHNSCYMDATLFAMFAFSMAFDSALFEHEELKKEAMAFRKHLRENIVNPLRRWVDSCHGCGLTGHLYNLRHENWLVLCFQDCFFFVLEGGGGGRTKEVRRRGERFQIFKVDYIF